MRVATLDEQNRTMADTVATKGTPRAHPGIGVWVLVALASLLSVATAFAAFGGDAAWSDQRRVPVGVLLAALAGAALAPIAAWVVAVRHRHASIGLAMTIVGATLPLWAGWSSLPDIVRVAMLAMAPLAVAGTAQVGLRWSIDFGSSRLLRWVYALTAAAAIVHLIGYNPIADPGCTGICSDMPSMLEGLISTRTVLVVAAALNAVAAIIAGRKLIRSNPATLPRLLAGGVVVALALMVSPPIVHWARWEDQQSSFVMMLPLVAVALVGGTVLIVAARARQTRVSIARLASRLSEQEEDSNEIGSSLGGLEFSLPGGGQWIDSLGRRVADGPDEHRYVVISDASGPVLRLPVARGREPGDVLDALSPAARLSLKNAQLTASMRARVADVQASRARVVATSDAERQRIERDLHDGAQQRLVSAAFYLSVARRRLLEGMPPLDQAEASVHEALGQLRRLAHGVFPRVLTTEGLWEALNEVVGDSLVPATMEVHGNDDIPIDTAMAAYATVVTAIEIAGRTPLTRAVRISARRQAESLEVSVEMLHDGPERDHPDLTDVRDRVGAVGGDLIICQSPEGILVEAVIPCAS